MNCNGPWEGYRQQAKLQAGEATSRPLSPSRVPLRAHRRETSGYEADIVHYKFAYALYRRFRASATHAQAINSLLLKRYTCAVSGYNPFISFSCQNTDTSVCNKNE